MTTSSRLLLLLRGLSTTAAATRRPQLLRPVAVSRYSSPAATRRPQLLRPLSTTAAVSRYSSPLLMLPSIAVASDCTPDSEVGLLDYSFYRLSDKKTMSLYNKCKTTHPGKSLDFSSDFIRRFIPEKHYKSFYYSTKSSHCIGSSNGWLLYCEPIDYTLFFVNPLVTPSPPMINLPSMTTLPGLSLVSSYTTTTTTVSSPPPDSESESESESKLVIQEPAGLVLRFNDPTLACSDEVMFTSIILSFSISGSPELENTIMMILKGPLGRLCFCRPAVDNKWTTMSDTYASQIVYSYTEKLFYTLAHNTGTQTEIETIDFSGSSSRTTLKQPAVKKYIQFFKDYYVSDDCQDDFLVESGGDILLVTWYYSRIFDKDGHHIRDEYPKYTTSPCKTHRFRIFKLNKEKNLWEKMESLEDRVLFVGKNEPFSVSANDFPELKRNSVYFAAPHLKDVRGVNCSEDWGIYNLEEDSITQHFPCGYLSKLRPPPVWIDCINSSITLNTTT